MKYSATTNGFYDELVHGDNIPSDAVEISTEDHAALLAGQSSCKRIVADADGYPTLQDPQPPTQAEIVAQYESAIDAHIDSVAHQYRYQDRLSFATRAGYVGPYQSEAIAFAQWMDSCNVQAFALLESVIAGEIEMPSIEAFIGSLPEFILP